MTSRTPEISRVAMRRIPRIERAVRRLAITAEEGATGDSESVQQTLPAAGEAVAEQIATPTADGEFAIHTEGIEEVVADKGYHSGEVLAERKTLGLRTYIAELERGPRKWVNKGEQKAAVWAIGDGFRGSEGRRCCGNGARCWSARLLTCSRWAGGGGCTCAGRRMCKRSCCCKRPPAIWR